METLVHIITLQVKVHNCRKRRVFWNGPVLGCHVSNYMSD